MQLSSDRCDFCGQALEVVWVHGHGQCRRCHTNIAPCCDGACEVDDGAEPARAAEPHEVERDG